MDQFFSEAHPLFGADDRARTFRLFFIALIGTPWLLFLEPARQIVSLEATLMAIALGVLLGSLIAVRLADVDLRDVNDVTASVVVLVCICVGTIAVWLIVPHQHLGTFLQFTLAFTWTMPITQWLVHRSRGPASS